MGRGFTVEIKHKRIDLSVDKDYVLECHCRINYECDTPWKRKMTYEEYRQEWFGMKTQINEFLDVLLESCKDSHSIVDIIFIKDEVAGYLWVPFFESEENDFAFAEIQDIYVEPSYRNRGIASYLFAYAEDKARQNGAKVIRSGTGCENKSSVGLHKKMGYYQYRFEFEKLF